MAIATKNRREITIKQRQFVWYFAEDYDSGSMVLRVASEDKKFLVHYHPGQKFLIVLGLEFPGLTQHRAGWTRVLCPQWDQNGIVTPASVHRLVDWSLHQERELVVVDYLGEPIESE